MVDEDREVAVAELLLVVGSLRIGVGRGDRADDVWVADPGDPQVVVALPAPTPGTVREVLERERGRRGIVVADRLGPRQRRLLEDAGWGWLDRRGSLRVQGRTVRLERDVDDLTGPEPEREDPLARPADRAVVLRLLAAPDEVPTVRALAAETDLSPGAVGRTLALLREQDRLGPDGLVDPARLLAELVPTWRPVWHEVAAPDALPDGPVADVLRVRRDDLGARGWALVGRHALAATRPDLLDPATLATEPLHLLVPDRRALAWAVRELGPPGDGPVLRLATAPVVTALDARRPWTRTRRPLRWPLAAPVVVAWSLALEPDAADLLAAWAPDGLPTPDRRAEGAGRVEQDAGEGGDP